MKYTSEFLLVSLFAGIHIPLPAVPRVEGCCVVRQGVRHCPTPLRNGCVMLRNNNTAADTCGIGVCEAEQVLDVFLELREYGFGVELLHQSHEQTTDDNNHDGDDDDIEERAFTAFVGQTVGNLCEKLLHRDTFLRVLPAIKIMMICVCTAFCRRTSLRCPLHSARRIAVSVKIFFTGAVPRVGYKSHGGDIALCNYSNNDARSVDRDTAADTCGIGIRVAEQALDVRLELREYGTGIELLHQGHEQTADNDDNDSDDDNIQECAFTAFIGKNVGNLGKNLLHWNTFLRVFPAIKNDVVYE